MSAHARYEPGPAAGIRVEKVGGKWTLVLVRDLRHPPERVWRALTDPAHLREWAPFDAEANLDRPGPVQATWVGTAAVTTLEVTRADPPRLLE